MRKSRFTESQIIGILAQQEQGMKVSQICREHRISIPTSTTGKVSIAEWM